MPPLHESLPECPPEGWPGRWNQLARAVGLGPAEPVLVALSGGADSVFLMHLLAAARAAGSGPPTLSAVHVDHGLRGPESDLDAIFCARLCRQLGVPFVSRRVELEAAGPSLEARAREVRYRVLAEEAHRTRCSTILTGHHADDGLETLLMRWIRGTHLPGLPGLQAQLELWAGERRLRVLRPLISMRRSEVRRLLSDHGHAWREDSSNASPRHTRNRVRNVLLPEVSRIAGTRGIENLFRFGQVVEELEETLAGATAYLSWSPPPWASATRSASTAHLGGALPRARLMRLPTALRRRALWRLVLEGCGLAPRQRLLERILDDLCAGRCGRHALPGNWSLQLRSAILELHPPRALLEDLQNHRGPQGHLPFPGPRRRGARAAPPAESRRFLATHTSTSTPLPIPGTVALEDGRRVTAEVVPDGDPAGGTRAVPRGSFEVELDAEDLCSPLRLRWPRPGDRFHPLGAAGRRPLTRFLADAGIPRDERSSVPLVCAGDELLWACGLRPNEPRRVRQGTRSRLRLTLSGASPAPAGEEPGAADGLAGPDASPLDPRVAPVR